MQGNSTTEMRSDVPKILGTVPRLDASGTARIELRTDSRPRTRLEVCNLFAKSPWPSNYPNPDVFSLASFSGLHRWVQSLSVNSGWKFVLDVLHRPIGARPTEEVYLQLLPVDAVFLFYDQCKEVEKATFAGMVSWLDRPSILRYHAVGDSFTSTAAPETDLGAGAPGISPSSDVIRGDGEDWEDAASDDSDETHWRESVGGGTLSNGHRWGYCYLNLFKDTHIDIARTALKVNPWGPALAAYLLDNPGEWTSNKVVFSVGHKVLPVAGQAYSQAHIQQTTHGVGISVKEVVPFLVGRMRVGATNTPVHTTAVANPLGSSHVMEVADRGGVDIDVPVAFAVDNVSDTFTFSPRFHPEIVRITQYFESVLLISAGFEIHVSGSPDAICRAAIGNQGTPRGNLGWIAAPYATMAGGNAQGPTTMIFELPSNHVFGREIKAAALGNRDPEFHFLFTASQSSYCFARGTLHVRVSGRGAAQAFNIGPRKIASLPVQHSQETQHRLEAGSSKGSPRSAGARKVAETEDESE